MKNGTNEQENKTTLKSDRPDHTNAADDKPVEIISLDLEDEGETPLELGAETTLDLLEDAREDAYEEELGQYTADPEIQEALETRQQLNQGGAELEERLREHHATSPTLAGGDLDAAWEAANVGEETAGGMAPTPDQDDVAEIGEAYGIVYDEDEPLATGDKLAERDEKRWELNPESAEKSD